MSDPVTENRASGELVTIIVTCYNYARFLPEALDSIAAQEYKHWECLVIDDGSTDDTRSVAERYVQQDERFSYYYQSNAGLSAARNKGIFLAKGVWIQFLDADDLLSADKLSVQLAFIKKSRDKDIVYSDYHLVDAEAKTSWSTEKTNWIEMRHPPFEEFLHYWEKGFSIPIHCFLFRKNCFDRWGAFDVSLPTHEDLGLNLNFSLAGAKYGLIKKVTAFYRVHGTSMARDLTRMHKGYLMVLLRLLKHPGAGAHRRGIRHRYFQEYLNTLIDKVVGRKLNFTEAVKNMGAGGLNMLALLLVPVYLLIKVTRKLR